MKLNVFWDTVELTLVCVYRYIDRFDDELEVVKAQMRPGRPIPVKFDEIKSAKKQEMDEFEGAGFEMADVTSEKGYKAFM